MESLVTSTEALIRDLADRAELADLVARHSVWIDEARYDESDQLFTADTVVKSIRGEARGIDGLVALARRAHESYARTMSNKSNLVIEIDGDAATVRAHDLSVFVLDEKTEAIATALHHYSARRTPEGWRFDRVEITPIALTGALDRSL
jgi:2-succinyl-5-enolpyruvyl-6-hydroxy-3-cyclohexene-1-carboxylate synthase